MPRSEIFINGGTFITPHGDFHTHSHITGEGRKGIDLLTNSIAPGAFHNSSERYDPPKCHPSTRVAVLQHIMTWINDLQKLCFFMWLYGPAGAGKSAIAQSIAELCHKTNILAASFFFSRTAVGRNDESRLIPTLVYQLCLSMPVIRKYVEETIEQDPLVLSRSLEAQAHSLVVEPICRALSDEKDAMSLPSCPKLIIIDGLDECGSGKIQRYVLTVLTTVVQEIPLPMSFLVVSRPEQVIRDGFHAEPLYSMTTRLALDNSYHPDDDIRLFFESKFNEIKQNHPLHNLLPPGWPSESEVLRLVQKSSGQFIYASTVMKYLDSVHHWPTDRLDIIFGLSSAGVDTPFAELDALYIHIFSTVKNIEKALELTSFLLLSQTDMLMTSEMLESIFFLRHGDVCIILSDLHSIMNVPAPDKTSDVIRIFHASLGDFLLDKSRSDKFHIDAGNAHANLTQHFLTHLSKAGPLSKSRDSSFAEALIKHLPLCSPTPELLDDLYKFDFYRFLTTFHSLETVMRHISYVFDWLKKYSHKNSSGKNLYSHHLDSLDEYLKSELVLFMTHSNLAQLMVTAVMLPKFLQHSLPIMRLLAIDLDKPSFHRFARTCRPVLFPFKSSVAGHMAKYHILLSEFLGDPIRSKEFYIDDDKFATLATTFAKYIFGPSMLGDPDNILQILQLHSEPTQQKNLLCAFACLPDCLLKASSSKGLATFLQKHEIPFNFWVDQCDGCNSEVTATAIKAYIMRCNVSKGPDRIMHQSGDSGQMNRIEHMASIDLGSGHSNPTPGVGYASIKQSRTEHESNCGCCHVM